MNRQTVQVMNGQTVQELIQVNMFQWLVFICLLPVVSCTLTTQEIEIFRENGIVVTETDSDSYIIEHSGLPDHGHEGGFGDNPNQPSAQNYSFEIPKEGVNATDKGCVRLGPIGISVSGVPFYNPYTGQGKNAVEGDCKETFDDCSGHPSPGGAYHYHKVPACLYMEPYEDRFLGVAFDGYPIYGPMDNSGRVWRSAELDPCHGHMYNGRYIYRITLDFPYILGCYNGVPIENDTNIGGGPGGGGPLGDRPPPPPGRKRRSDKGSNLQPKRYKRQIPGSDNPCLQVADRNWNLNTCYAFCENPGNGSLDNCVPASERDDQKTQRPTSTGSSQIGTEQSSTRPTTEGDTSASCAVMSKTLLVLCAFVLNIFFSNYQFR